MNHRHIRWASYYLLGIALASLIFSMWMFATASPGSIGGEPSISLNFFTVTYIVMGMVTHMISVVLKQQQANFDQFEKRLQQIETLVCQPSSAPAPSPTEVRPAP